MGCHFLGEHFQRSLIDKVVVQQHYAICQDFSYFGYDGHGGESTVFITGGGLALAGLLGLKAALFGGVLIGAAASRRRHYYKPSRKSYSKSYKTHKYRYGRSIEDEEIIDEHEALSNAILDASLNDAEDCAKKLICSLNAKEVSTLASDESAIAELFGKSGSIDVSAATAEFDLAALMGRQAGKAQCETIYARC